MATILSSGQNRPSRTRRTECQLTIDVAYAFAAVATHTSIGALDLALCISRTGQRTRRILTVLAGPRSFALARQSERRHVKDSGYANAVVLCCARVGIVDGRVETNARNRRVAQRTAKVGTAHTRVVVVATDAVEDTIDPARACGVG